MRYIIQYTLPYEHRVMVGITADDPDEAVARAEDLFDQGELWQDSAEVPLLFDDYEEVGGDSLVFTVEQTLSVDESWPEADASVKESRRREAAFLAAQRLVEAYRRGEERGGSIIWEDLNRAYDAALDACGTAQSQSIEK